MTIPRFSSEKELLDFVVPKVVAQGKKSTCDNGACKYRGDGGTKCSAGFVIPDEHYSPRLEGLSALDLVGNLSKILGYMDSIKTSKGDPLTLSLHSLQKCHDSSLDGPYFVEQFLTSVKRKFPSYEVPPECLIPSSCG